MACGRIEHTSLHGMIVFTRMDIGKDVVCQANSMNYQCSNLCSTTSICKGAAFQLPLIIWHLHRLSGFSSARVPLDDVLLSHPYVFFALSFSRVLHHRVLTSRGCPYLLHPPSIANTANNSVVVEPHEHDNMSGHTRYIRNVYCRPHGEHRTAMKGFPFYNCTSSWKTSSNYNASTKRARLTRTKCL